MDNLNNVDIKIIRLIAEGTTQQQMASLLGYPEGTIETMRHRLYKKVKVFNAPHLVAWAFRNKVLN